MQEGEGVRADRELKLAAMTSFASVRGASGAHTSRGEGFLRGSIHTLRRSDELQPIPRANHTIPWRGLGNDQDDAQRGLIFAPGEVIIRTRRPAALHRKMAQQPPPGPSDGWLDPLPWFTSTQPLVRVLSLDDSALHQPIRLSGRRSAIARSAGG